MHKSLSRFFVLALVAMALMMLVGSVAAVGPTVTPGYTAYDEQIGGVRYRSFANTGADEIYLGVPDLGLVNPPGDRVQRQLVWANGTNNVTFTYDAVADKLTTEVVNSNGTYSLEYPNFSSEVAGLGRTYLPEDLNVMQITVSDRDSSTGAVEFNNVLLNGESLGSFSQPDAYADWMVTDYCFGKGFTLTGEVELSGSFSTSQEAARVEVKVGVEEDFGLGCGAPPSVDPSGDAQVCDAGTVNIAINNVEDLYGYQFKATYDQSLVSVENAYFQYGFFDTNGNGATAPNWDADCAGGVCQFARTEQFPDDPVSGSGVVASIDFKSLYANAASFTLQITDLKLTDRDGFVIEADPGSLEVDVCGSTTISGKIGLQGRPWMSGVDISAAGLGFEVEATGPLGTFPGTITNFADGSYEITGVKYFSLGTDYTVNADHSLYLVAETATPVSVSGPVTNLDTTLYGGDARNDGGVDIDDVGCIAGVFDMAAPPVGDGTCGADPLSSPDINADSLVNIQDLSIAGGNFTRPEPTDW